jgi:hypothetical protein
MDSRNGLHGKGSGAGHLVGLPGLQPDRGRPQPAGGTGMGENQWCRQREPTTVVVQVVGMLVVADQNRIHRSQRVGAHRGTGDLGQIGMHAGRIEGRVHHDPAAGDVDDRRRAAQHTDRTVAPLGIHVRLHGANSGIDG